MKLSSILLVAGLAHATFAIVLPSRAGDRGGTGLDRRYTLQGATRSDVHRRGREYTLDEENDLEEQSENANEEQIAQSMDHIIDLFQKNNVEYALTGGIAMQKYGMLQRKPKDADMVVNVKTRDMLDIVSKDPDILQPKPLSAASGCIRLFLKIGNQPVQTCVFVKGGDLAPSLDGAVTLEGYRVVSIRELVNSKLKRDDEKDQKDVIWLAENKQGEVRSIANSISQDLRYDFAERLQEDDNPALDTVCEALDVTEFYIGDPLE